MIAHAEQGVDDGTLGPGGLRNLAKTAGPTATGAAASSAASPLDVPAVDSGTMVELESNLGKKIILDGLEA